MLEPGAYVRAIVPFVDDLERVFQKQERAFDGPVFLRTASIRTGEHMVTPEQNKRGRPLEPTTFFATLDSTKAEKT